MLETLVGSSLFCRTRRLGRRWWMTPAVAAAVVAAGGCGQPAPAEPPLRVLKLTTGPVGGGFYPLGRQLALRLNERLPDMQLEAVVSAGAVANVEAVRHGHADLALTFSDVAYLGFSGRLEPAFEPMQDIRGIAVLQLTPVALAVRQGVTISSPAGLRGRSVSVGPRKTGTALTAELIMEAFGLDESNYQPVWLDFSEAAEQLLSGQLDAMFINAIDQAESLIAATEGGARLVAIEGPPVERLRSEYPFLRPTLIARDLYPAMPSSTRTLGVDGLLICRSNLPDDLIYRLTKEFVEVFPELSLVGQASRMNLDLAPATPIPLHPGAARYYRERSLLR